MIEVIASRPTSISAQLYNFDIAQHKLKSQHVDWLRRHVVGFLRQRGSLWITGVASPSDTEDFNLGLSRRRADEVVGFLRKESPGGFQIAHDLAAGEYLARSRGVADGTESSYWRGVLVYAWNMPTPPPPPPPPPLRPVPKKPVVKNVIRKARVSFWTEYSDSPDPSDPAMAQGLNKYARERMQEGYFETMPLHFDQSLQPETHQLIRVFTQRSKTGFNAGIASTSTTHCRVYYQWGVRKRPCHLIHGYWRDGAFVSSPPWVYSLSDKEANEWLRDPRVGLAALSNRSPNATSPQQYAIEAVALGEPSPPPEVGYWAKTLTN